MSLFAACAVKTGSNEFDIWTIILCSEAWKRFFELSGDWSQNIVVWSKDQYDFSYRGIIMSS